MLSKCQTWQLKQLCLSLIFHTKLQKEKKHKIIFPTTLENFRIHVCHTFTSVFFIFFCWLSVLSLNLFSNNESFFFFVQVWQENKEKCQGTLIFHRLSSSSVVLAFVVISILYEQVYFSFLIFMFKLSNHWKGGRQIFKVGWGVEGLSVECDIDDVCVWKFYNS